MTSLLLFTVLQGQAQAQPDANLPIRPTTFMVDDRISMGAVENFREIYINQSTLHEQLTPIQSTETESAEVDLLADVGEASEPEAEVPAEGETAVLPIINDSTSWAEVVVGDVKVGVIGPLTNGAIRGVKAGTYQVGLTIMTGYSVTRDVHTVEDLPPISPGGEGARPALEAGQTPTWNSDGN